MTATDSLPILVVGGGIGGLAAALALSRQGLSSHVLEKNDAFGEVGAGIQLGPNVFRMFERLGLTEAIRRVAVFPEALVMNDALSGDTITRIPLGEAIEQRFGYPYGVIYRPDLHQALLAACESVPLIRLSLQQAVVSCREHENGVDAITASGESHPGSALIGADGLWSGVRQQLLGDIPPRVSGHIAYRAVLPAAEVPVRNQLNQVVLWAGPRTHLVHYPLHRGELFNLVAVFHSARYEEGWDTYGDATELTAHFSGQHPGVLRMLEKIDEWRMWVLCDREPISDWSKGRITLLGDAAHPMLQYLAQGACMAIEDAVCLADRIVRHDSDFPAAFLDYQSSRYLRTARVQLTARFYGEVYHATDAVRDLRRIMLANRKTDQAYEGVAWLYEGIDATGAQTGFD